MKNEVVHYEPHSGLITPCGRFPRPSALLVTKDISLVTCKLCLKTNWFKKDINQYFEKSKKDRIEHINKFLETNSLYLPKTKNLD